MKEEKRRYYLFPKTLAQCVDPIAKPLFKARGLAGTRMLTDWPQIAGKELASHCWPEKVSFPKGKKTDGTLTIGVENGFALELQHMQPVILERVNRFYGYQALTRLAIYQGATRKKPSIVKAPPRKISGAVYDPSSIQDPELKKALQSLANSLNGF
jgi:hypothetical protein